jgi:hypothetical protein
MTLHARMSPDLKNDIVILGIRAVHEATGVDGHFTPGNPRDVTFEVSTDAVPQEMIAIRDAIEATGCFSDISDEETHDTRFDPLPQQR